MSTTHRQAQITAMRTFPVCFFGNTKENTTDQKTIPSRIHHGFLQSRSPSSSKRVVSGGSCGGEKHRAAGQAKIARHIVSRHGSYALTKPGIRVGMSVEDLKESERAGQMAGQQICRPDDGRRARSEMDGVTGAANNRFVVTGVTFESRGLKTGMGWLREPGARWKGGWVEFLVRLARAVRVLVVVRFHD